MKVLMVAAVEFPPDARIEKEARALIEAGHEVTLLCLKKKGHEASTYKGINLVRLPFGESRLPAPLNWIVDYSLYSEIGCWYTYWHSIGKRAIHVHNPPDFMVPFLMPLKLFGKKIVFDAHDPTHVLAMSRLRKPKTHWLVRLLKFFFLAAAWSASAVVTISPQVARMLGKKAIIVPNSPGDEFFLKPKYPKKNTAIYIGAMVPGRGLELLVKSMEKVDGELLMVGKGDILGKLKALAPANVKFTGEVPYSKVPSYLQKASVAVLPFEPTPINTIGSPNKLYEYMALGMPVVCTDLPGPKRIAKDAAVFVEFSEKGFAKGISRLFKSPKLRERLGRRARAIAEKKFRWPIAKKPLLDFYSSI